MKRNTRRRTRNLKRQTLLCRKRSYRNYLGRLGVRTRRGNHRRVRNRARQTPATRKIANPGIQMTTPAIFNLRKNREPMLRFYDELRGAIAEKRMATILMDDITDVSIGSLLYLVAIIVDARQNKVQVSGTVPHDRRCAAIIDSSGFFDFVHAVNRQRPKVRMNIAKITYHKKHDTRAIKELCEFVCGSIGKDMSKDAEPLFATLSELVQNTIGHAYKDMGSNGQWYVAAEHLKEENAVEVTFLDTGAGIPATVHRRIYELIPNPFAGKDEQLIMSALKGDLRTSTGKRYRGKGLPEIYGYSNKGDIRELAIASGRGYIYRNQPYHLDNEFFGTLFSFRIGG